MYGIKIDDMRFLNGLHHDAIPLTAEPQIYKEICESLWKIKVCEIFRYHS